MQYMSEEIRNGTWWVVFTNNPDPQKITFTRVVCNSQGHILYLESDGAFHNWSNIIQLWKAFDDE